jgi:hypothetical protein
MSSSLLYIEIAMVVFAVILVVVCAFLLNPPTSVVDKMGKKKNDTERRP